MAIDNPTKTRRIEQAYRRENRNRFKMFAKGTKEALQATQKPFITNADFEMTQDDIERFMRFLRNRAYTDIIGVTSLENANSAVNYSQTDEWATKYTTAAYLKGLEVSARQMRLPIVDGLESVEDVARLFDIASDRSAARIFIQANAIHGETIDRVQQLAFSSLIQAVETMLAQMNREIENAVSDGNVSTRTLSKSLVNRISVGNSTGEQIASTTTIQAAQRAQINAAPEFSARIGEDVNLRWITRFDNKVRPLHVEFHGRIMTPEEAQININISPFNCRCGFQQVTASRDTKQRQARFDRDRTRLGRGV